MNNINCNPTNPNSAFAFHGNLCSIPAHSSCVLGIQGGTPGMMGLCPETIVSTPPAQQVVSKVRHRVFLTHLSIISTQRFILFVNADPTCRKGCLSGESLASSFFAGKSIPRIIFLEGMPPRPGPADPRVPVRIFLQAKRGRIVYLHTLSGILSNRPPAASRTFSIATSKLLRWDASEK